MLLQFPIGRDHFIVEIDIAPIDELYIHEEVVESNLISLIKSLKTSGFQRDPIIVDKNSGVILDGMHRYSALKRLGMGYITVAKVDYFDENIILRRWFRIYESVDLESIRFEKKLRDVITSTYLIEKNNLDIDKSDLIEYPDKTSIKIWFNDRGILEYNIDLRNLSLTERFDILRKIENEILSPLYGGASYQTEQQAINHIKKTKKSLVIGIPTIDKKDVVSIATKGKVFPPKTTRHIIPARPLFLNVPLGLLKKDGVGSNLESKRFLLERLLENKMLIQVKGKVEIDRLYEENALFVFV